MVFDLFIDNDIALIFWAKRGHEEELQDLTLHYQQTLKMSLHVLVVQCSINERRCADVEEKSSHRHAPPLPPLVQPRDASDRVELDLDV